MLWKKHIAVLMILGLVVQAGGYVEWLHVRVEHTDHCHDADTEACPDSEEPSEHSDETCTVCLQLHIARYKVIIEVSDYECLDLTIVGDAVEFEAGGDFDHIQRPFGARGPPVPFSYL